MAEYDLTQRMVPYLDRHLALLLLDFLQERQVHPDENILLRKIELLTRTHMVDYYWSVHKSLFNSQEVPKHVLEKKGEVDETLRTLERSVAPMTCFLQNPHSFQHLTADRDYNLKMLHQCYKIGSHEIQALYEYGKFQFESGNYSVVAKYFDQYIPLSTNMELQFSSMWGKLGAEILVKNWNAALRALYRLKRIIDLVEIFESPTDQDQSIVWLAHWSLFVFFNYDNGILHLIDLFNQDKYFDVVQSNAPHLLRYLLAAFIITKSGKPQFENFIKVVQSGRFSYEDPITEFFTCLYVNDNFDGAERKMEKCVEVILSDPFLGKRCEDGSYPLRDEFLLSAGCFIFDNYCKTHQPMEISALATRLNSTHEGAERCTRIQDSNPDAGIDAVPEPNHSNVFENALSAITPSIFQHPPPLSDSQPMAGLLSSQGIGYSPSPSPYLLDDIVNHWHLHGRTTANTEAGDAYVSEQGMTMGENHEMPRNNEQVNRSNNVNDKRKRKRVVTPGDDCKRCSCEKSQCLQLYCECFAAGLYCDETCACEECINRPEYEETVFNKRAMIETRNQNAFAPDLVPRNEDPSLNGGTQLDLANARHRRGCRCKKSQCQKNYCECYQANVKCSEGCRCVGCKNTYNPEQGFPRTSQ